MTGKIVEGKKNAGVKAKTTTTEKPDENDEKKNYEDSGQNWQPAMAVVDVPDFRD